MGELVAQAEAARAALQACGRARAAAYAAQGRRPEQRVSLSGSDDPAEEAAAIEDALWARRASEQDTAAGGPFPGRDLDPMRVWEQRCQEVRAQLVLVERACNQLPQRDRTARRMLDVWVELGTMRLGHGQNDRDVAALEERAWHLLSALPADRCPRGAPRMLAREYRRWDRSRTVAR